MYESAAEKVITRYLIWVLCGLLIAGSASRILDKIEERKQATEQVEGES